MPLAPAFPLKPLVWLMLSLPLAATAQERVTTAETEEKTLNSTHEKIESGDHTYQTLTLKNGTLNILGGAKVRSIGAFKITDSSHGASTLSLSGAGSKLAVEGETTVAGSADAGARPAALLVQNGATLDLSHKTASFSNSALTVDGKDSELLFSTAGIKLNASTLKVSNEGVVTHAGEAVDSQGVITLEGTGLNQILVERGGSLYATKLTGGDNTKARIVLKQGATLTVGQDKNPEDESVSLKDLDLHISGADSKLVSLRLKASGKAMIVLEDGGTLQLNKTLTLSGENATLVIGGRQAAAAPGILITDEEGSHTGNDGIKFEHDGGKQKLIFNHLDTSGQYRFTAKIDGKAAIEQKAGYTVLAGQTLTGATTVTGGTLALEQTTLTGDLSVGQGGTLVSGSGKLGNTTINKGGSLVVGATPADVNGTFTLAPGALLAVTLDGRQTPQLKASGAAKINDATLSVTARGDFELGQPYTVLESPTLTGTFKSVQTHSAGAFLASTVGYTSKTATVTLHKKASFDAVASTGNARSAGRGLESLNQNDPLYRHVLTLAEGPAPQVLQQLSGDSLTSVASALQGMAAASPQSALPMKFLRANLNAGLLPGAALAQSSGGLPASALPSSAALPMWAEVTGIWQRENARQGNPEVRANTGGVFIGTDRAISPQWRLGAAVGLTHTGVQVSSRSAKAAIDNYSASLYGARHWDTGRGQLNLILGTAYTWHDINTRRDMARAGLPATLRAHHGASTWQLFTELSHFMPLSPRASLEPYAGLSWSNLRTRAFNETGGIAALQGQAQSQSNLSTTLGLRGIWNTEVGSKAAALRANVGWRLMTGDLTPRNTLAFNGGQPFTVAGNGIARHAVLVELGGDLALNRRATLGLDYGGEFGAGSQQHRATLRARWAF